MAFCKGKCVQWEPNAAWGKLTSFDDPKTEIFAIIRNMVDGQPLAVGDIVEYQAIKDEMGNIEAKSIRKLQSAPQQHPKPRRMRKGSVSDDEKQEVAPDDEQYTAHPPLQHHASPPSPQNAEPHLKQRHAQQQQQQQHQHPEYQQPQRYPPHPEVGAHQQHQQPTHISPKSKSPYNSPQQQQYKAPLQHNDAATYTTPEGYTTSGAPVGAAPTEWACAACTFGNHSNARFCGMCGGPKPTVSQHTQHQQTQYQQQQPQYQHQQPQYQQQANYNPQAQSPQNYPPQYGAYPMHEPLRAQISEDIDEDKEVRKNWVVNDLVEVFSTSLQKWCEAKIIDICPQNVWLTVRYTNVAKKREIKRSDANIRGIPRGGTAECTPEAEAPPQQEEQQINLNLELHKKVEAVRLKNIKLKSEIEKQRLRQKQELHDKKMRFENQLQEDKQREKELDARIKNIIEMEKEQEHKPYDLHSDFKGNEYPQAQQPSFQTQSQSYGNERRQPQYNAYEEHNPQMYYNAGSGSHASHATHSESRHAIRGDMFSRSGNIRSAGKVYLQKGFFTQSQMQKVQQRYGQNSQSGPKFLFGDNYADRYRAKGVQRNAFGGQSKVMGHYDRSFGFGIPTTFSLAKQLDGFTFNSHSFRNLVKQLFDELVQHISNGGDIVIPSPTQQIMRQAPHKYFKDGERFVFHNIGTGQSSLKIDDLIVIQNGIERLKQNATQTIECNEAYSN